MFEPYEAGDSTEVDCFLQTARATLVKEAYTKSRRFGFDFIGDRPIEPAQRYVWTEDNDRQLKLSSTNFAQKRLQELRMRQERLTNVRVTLTTHAVFEETHPTSCEGTEKKLYFDADDRRSFARSSMSTLPTRPSERRSSINPFDFLEDDLPERDSDVDS
mmetsp:Transcript_14143/g.26605  ORF Transcript_14143/g.26605 Transcript_14143/m.26605 type:complete len:160 (-) Transcript_14143:2465-2944(-)